MICHKCGSPEEGQFCRRCGCELPDSEALTTLLAEHAEFNSAPKTNRVINEIKKEVAENEYRIKLLGVVSAGQPIEAIFNEESVGIPFDFPEREDLFALRVRGDSMICEQMRDSDYIIVKSQQTANNGDIVVALVDGGNATARRFYKGGNQVRLEPANPDYEPIIVSPPERVTIQGVVIGLIRKYDG